MNRIQQLCISYLKGFIHDDEGLIDRVPSGSEWNQLFHFLLDQDMAAIVYPFVSGLQPEKRPDDTLLDRWRNSVVASVATHMQDLHLIQGVLEAFEQSAVPVMMIKGIAVAAYYKEPDYRLMRDVDFNVLPEHFSLAEKVMTDLGYSLLKGNEKKHAVYVKEQGLYVEIHRSLYHPGYAKALNLAHWDGSVWLRCKPREFRGAGYLCMSDEDALIHQMLHLAVHVAHSDVTLKQLIDSAVIIRKKSGNLDWNYIEGCLKSMGLIKFAKTVFNAHKELLDLDIPDRMIAETEYDAGAFIDLLMTGFAVEQSKDQYRCFKHLVFNHPALSRYGIFQPVVWWGELMVGLTYHRLSLADSFRHASSILSHYRQSRIIMSQIGLH